MFLSIVGRALPSCEWLICSSEKSCVLEERPLLLVQKLLLLFQSTLQEKVATSEQNLQTQAKNSEEKIEALHKQLQESKTAAQVPTRSVPEAHRHTINVLSACFNRARARVTTELFSLKINTANALFFPDLDDVKRSSLILVVR